MSRRQQGQGNRDEESDTQSQHAKDVDSGEQLSLIQGHDGYVRDIVFSSDGKRLASGGKERAIRWWSVPDGKPLGVVGSLHSLEAVVGPVRIEIPELNGPVSAPGRQSGAVTAECHRGDHTFVSRKDSGAGHLQVGGPGCYRPEPDHGI